MENLTLISEPLKRYVGAAHTIGLTVGAITGYLNTHGIGHVTEEHIRNILKAIRRSPKSTYPWYICALESSPRNLWSSRFIWICKAKNETNSNILDKMRKYGYEIPGEHWVQIVWEEHLFIESELVRGCGTHGDAALQKAIIRAHDWGYTVYEIARKLPLNGSRPTPKIDTNLVKKTLRSNGIPEAYHRSGRKYSAIAIEFALCAYNLGMDVSDIRDQLYVHGFDDFPIVDHLNTMGGWRGQRHGQMIPCQKAEPTQPRARDGDFSGVEKDAPQSVLANQKPSRKINVAELLN